MDNDYSFFIGDVALDEYYRAPYWPKISDKVLVETLKPQMGGSIANAASVYNSYNESVYFLSLLNGGEITQSLLADLQKQGIDTSYVLYDDSLPDAKNIIVLAEGEHTLIIPTLGIQQIEITHDILDVMCKAKYVYTTIGEIRPLRYGNMNAIEIIKKVRESGAKMVYDLDVGHIESGDGLFFKEMDIVFFNQIGFDVYRKDASYEEAVSQLLSYGTEVVVVTHAEKGCSVHTKDQNVYVEGISVDVVDVTGAGDTFCSSFIYALNKCNNLKMVAKFANAAAARSVTVMGARGGISSTEVVLDFMREKGLEPSNEYNCFIE
ncbi:carbohydrate kinase family protein [Bacillus sp. RG28]|uniref:Carbohydrate kinase family protein n=1 Tax=Gottfriedia endophytica TaxID=2820819 RepID=A0A940SIS8_9BACI|nr:carbohydrate kinase family protein [Gottfriedia endophytica]MBP0724144.1 carbohydrate kinase family protein [Gottfriedia endophytica]